MTKARDLADLISAGNPLADGAISVSEISDLTATAAEINQLDNTADLPDIRPSLLLDFANSKTLDPRITFTRGSTATYWDGKTTAKAEENLAQYSQQFDNGYWTKLRISVSSDQTAAPDGTTTADQIIESTDTGTHGIVKGPLGVTDATMSVFAKQNTRSGVVIKDQSGNGASFNLSSGTVISTTTNFSSSITSVGNGWYRCTVSGTFVNDGLVIALLDGSNQSSYTGDGTSSIYLWGAQVEQRSSATAYTATTTSPIVKYQPVLQTAASGEARFDHDPVTGESKGLLIEEARTNINTTSEHVGAGYNTTTNASALENYGIAPDGMQTADLLVENTATAFHQIVQAYAGPTSGETWTYSVFVKRGNGSRHFALRLRDSSGTILVDDNNAIVYFDLSTGTVSSSSDVGNVTLVGSSIEDAGNGWYRCSISGYISNLVSSYMVNNFMTTSAGSGESYAGDGFSSMLVWGMQMEQGSFPTSYIPTSGSTVTRIGEFAAMSSSEIGYYGGDFTVYSASTLARNNTIAGSTTLLIGSRLASNITPLGRNYHYQYYRANGTSGSTTVLENTIYADTNPTGTITANQELRIATAYSKDNFATSGNGGTVSTDASVPDFYDIKSIHFGNGNQLLNGHLSKVAFWNERLPNATLQAMTEA